MASNGATSEKPLKCGVIGAGIAGLAAAIALRRAGHDVELFERSRFKHEIGAAITMCPNANVVLDGWGFKREMAGATPKRQLRRLQWDMLESTYQESYDHVDGKYTSPFDAFHRVDLHKAIREMATNQYGAKVSLGTEVKEVDCKQGLVKLASGETVEKDLIVIADGVRSQFTAAITGEVESNVTTWGSIFRTIIPMDRLMDDPTVACLFENETSGFLVSANHPKIGFITYPCRDDTLMNVAIFHPSLHHLQTDSEWSNPATIDDVLSTIQDFPDFWKNLVKKADADAFRVYRVQHRAAIPTMVNGKACIIGDSAHGMMPTYAQGGCMGIEDAAAFEALLSSMGSDTVESRLKLWNQLRLPRCAVTQHLSNGRYTTTEDRDAVVRPYYDGPIPALGVSPWSDPWNDMWWRYNILDEAAKVLKYKDAPDGIPKGALSIFGPYDPKEYDLR